MSREKNEDTSSNSEPERDSTPPDIDLVLNSVDPDKDSGSEILNENSDD